MQFYNGVMDAEWNPLRAIPSVSMRHLIMQLLSWMWCIIFSLYFGSFVVFGITVVAHFLLIFGTFMEHFGKIGDKSWILGMISGQRNPFY